jgi:hypothetical protein
MRPEVFRQPRPRQAQCRIRQVRLTSSTPPADLRLVLSVEPEFGGTRKMRRDKEVRPSRARSHTELICDSRSKDSPVPQIPSAEAARTGLWFGANQVSVTRVKGGDTPDSQASAVQCGENALGIHQEEMLLIADRQKKQRAGKFNNSDLDFGLLPELVTVVKTMLRQQPACSCRV